MHEEILMPKSKIAHLMFSVSNMKKSKKFYTPIMKFFGFKGPGRGDMAFYESSDGLTIVVASAEKKSSITRNVHLAYSVTTRKQVDRFYELAMAAGGKSEGKPGIRANYGPNYYGAFVLDPDGNNIEAVCFSKK
jgi:catechol 2,3-dioxygenase-like lactoylglutathione lyase family enzyme